MCIIGRVTNKFAAIIVSLFWLISLLAINFAIFSILVVYNMLVCYLLLIYNCLTLFHLSFTVTMTGYCTIWVRFVGDNPVGLYNWDH
jgi:hypothetical protein